MDEEGEIEYLDEDADLIQQYVQNTPITPAENVQIVQTYEDIEQQITPLLVERRPQENKRKIKTDSDYDYDPNDSDYDPSEDLLPQRKKKKTVRKETPLKPTFPLRTYNNKKVISKVINTTSAASPAPEEKLKSLPNLIVKKQLVSKNGNVSVKKHMKKISYNDVKERKKLDIRIPNYEDPICLPVRGNRREEYDLRRLKVWNNLCLDWFKKKDMPLKPARGETVGSVRTIVLKNVKDKRTGKIDTTVYGKVSVENEFGEIKTDAYQSVLPKYREKKVLASYPLRLGESRHAKHVFEAVLSKETYKGEESLVIYKPKEGISAVYKFLEKPVSEEVHQDRGVGALKEVACCKLCAPCYQTSWRGAEPSQTPNRMPCPICKRAFVSVYNLLTHVKNGHKTEEIRAHKKDIAKTLATVVDYHYKCRICQEIFTSIKELRKHVPDKHHGSELFRCEIGNHMAS